MTKDIYSVNRNPIDINLVTARFSGLQCLNSIVFLIVNMRPNCTAAKLSPLLSEVM